MGLKRIQVKVTYPLDKVAEIKRMMIDNPGVTLSNFCAVGLDLVKELYKADKNKVKALLDNVYDGRRKQWKK